MGVGGNFKKIQLECDCGCQREYPCECRVDGTHVVYGYVNQSSGSPCEINPINGSSAIKPTTNKAFRDGTFPDTELCLYTYSFLVLVNAFPPDCTETDPDVLSYRVVFVNKNYGDAPLIDNSRAGHGDWYAVVYRQTTDTILGIFYDYEVCCHNNTEEDPASSHLSWVKFNLVTLGASVYDLYIYNPDTAEMYGDCGYALPFEVIP